MFGQVPTASESQVLTFLIGGAAILGIVYLGLGVWDKARKLMGNHRTVQVQPVETHLATREEVQQLRDWTFERFETMQIDRARTLGELHEKINKVAEDVAFIRGRIVPTE